MSIRVGILGYGNLGRGVECAIRQNPDMELKAVFTRRAPETVKILTEGVPVYHVDEAEAIERRDRRSDPLRRYVLRIFRCRPRSMRQWFNVVDSFDTHARDSRAFRSMSMRPHRKPEMLASSP